MRYDDLRLSVRAVGGGRYLVVAGGAVSTVLITRPDSDLVDAAARFRHLVRAELDGEPGGEPHGEVGTGAIDRLGRGVAELLFPVALREPLRHLSRGPAAGGSGLRVRVDLPRDLADNPVETAVLPDWQRDGYDRPFVRQDRRSLVRTVPGPVPSAGRLPQPDEEPAVVSLLVVVAHPAGCELDGEEFGPLSAEAEAEALERRMTVGEHSLDVRVTVLGAVGDRAAADRATRGRLQAWLADQHDRPAAVVVLAHGRWNAARERGEILLEHEDGSVDPVSGAALAADLLAAPRLRLAVLNLCSGGRAAAGGPYSSVAQEMVGQGIPAVVAMQSEVSDQAATAVTPVLVDSVLAGHPIDAAVAGARQAVVDVRPRGTVEWAVPVVALSAHCPDGVLFRRRLSRPDTEDPGAVLRRAYRTVTAATGRYELDQIVDAARWARRCDMWEEVARIAGTQPDDRRTSALLEEARIELARADLLRMADVLHEGADPETAYSLLERHRQVLPARVIALLDRELEEATALADLHDQAVEAEQARQWDEACEYWSELVRRRPGYRDCADRVARLRAWLELHGALGRAERAGDWGRAADLCRGAEPPVAGLGLDVRMRYYLFRDADATGEADGVLRSYPDLPDAYADGEVGRRRAFALACRCAADGDRAGAVAAVRPFDDDAMEGRVGARRREWAGELAELRGDWSGAAEQYAAHPDRETWAAAATYASACAAEEEHQDWPRAAELWSRLDPAHRDVGRRVAYSAGRVAEQEGRWSEALGHYRVLSVADRDTAARTAYCAQRLDPDRTPDPALGEHPDGPSLLAYLAGVRAERAGDWPGAADAFARCPGHRDADRRGRYARGRADDADGRWATALDAYRSALAQDDGREPGPGAPPDDAGDRAHRIETLSARLPFLDGPVADGLVADPGVPVADGPLGLKHVVDDPEVLRSARSALTARDPDPLGSLVAAAPADGPLLLLLAGRAEEAVSAWQGRVVDDPGDTAALHHLAVRAFATGEADPSPRWAAILADDAYHRRWSATTGHDAVRELAAAAAAAADPVETAVELFGANATRSLGAGPAHGPRLSAQLVGRVGIGVLVEGVERALDEDGTVPADDGAFDVEALRGSPRRSRAALRAVRLAFSPFAAAAADAASGDLDGAVDRLESLVLAGDLPVTVEADCAARDRTDRHAATCGACAAFLRDAPAHRPSRHRAVLLAQDGAALAAAVRLARAARSLDRARTSIGDPRLGGHGDLDDALRDVVAARDWAEWAALGTRLRERVVRTVADWADDMTGPHDPVRYLGPTGPVDAAVVLLRGTVAAVGPAGPLVDRLARLLYRRRRPDTWRTRKDLYEVLALSPRFVDARAALVQELSPHSGRPDADGWADAADAFDVVDAAVAGGERLHPEMQDAVRTLARDVADLALRSVPPDERGAVLRRTGRPESLDERIRDHRERAARAADAGHPDLALAWWCEALHTRPSDRDLRHAVADRVRDRGAGHRRPAGGGRS